MISDRSSTFEDKQYKQEQLVVSQVFPSLIQAFRVNIP